MDWLIKVNGKCVKGFTAVDTAGRYTGNTAFGTLVDPSEAQELDLTDNPQEALKCSVSVAEIVGRIIDLMRYEDINPDCIVIEPFEPWPEPIDEGMPVEKAVELLNNHRTCLYPGKFAEKNCEGCMFYKACAFEGKSDYRRFKL